MASMRHTLVLRSFLPLAVLAALFLSACPSGMVPPTANFQAQPTSGTAPLTVQFNDTSQPGSIPIVTWFWNFGDGGTSTARHPSHTYTAPGTYSVSLAVTSAHGSDTITRSSLITVGGGGGGGGGIAPVASFSASPRTGTAPLRVQFTDTSNGNGRQITGWLWEFGDGATSAQRNPEHTYTGIGTYTVSLRVTTSAGSNRRTEQNFITVTTGGTGPTANFEGTPRSGTAPLTVKFTDASTLGTGSSPDWLWNFGDGATSTARNPSHTYTSPGTYTVTLRVRTSLGQNTATKLGYITVTSAGAPPVADFSAAPRSGTTPLTVQFTDKSAPGGGAITSWLWTFGDGTTSTARNPSKVYTQVGSHPVSLRVTNAFGSHMITKAAFITVQAPSGSQAEYDRGFRDGYAEDEEYWMGYYDSWDTRDGGEIYYSGHEIPYFDELSYRAGYWDGVWEAYNDGYFVAYDHAFTIGFSEGYDAAYQPNWRQFLRNDEHVEWLDGGFTDGYNDGFSEGRILGAVDYDAGFPFDWRDALAWYRAGNDAYIPSLDLGTGEFGPVILYEWGQNPHELVFGKSTASESPRRGVDAPRAPLSVRAGTEDAAAEKSGHDIRQRPFTKELRELLNVRPSTSPRSETPLRLGSTWLERIEGN